VDYESKREEDFYDVQLDVKDCPDIYASLEKYTTKGMKCHHIIVMVQLRFTSSIPTFSNLVSSIFLNLYLSYYHYYSFLVILMHASTHHHTIELLDGENQYDAGECGKQDAEKGVTFTKFPPVLTIHLKRFDFDLQRMAFTKIHDR
jgi:hypothetical protein